MSLDEIIYKRKRLKLGPLRGPLNMALPRGIKPVEVVDSDETELQNVAKDLIFAFLNGSEEDIVNVNGY